MKRSAAIILFILCLCVLPATAVILEVTISGTVSGIDRSNNTLTVANPARYGCSYAAGGEKSCSFTAMENATLTGTVPADSTFSIFSPGDPVIATSLGGAGGKWISLARLTGLSDSRTVSYIVGEPSAIPLPYAGDYSLDLRTEPDCTTCSGTICTAASSYVKILSSGRLVTAGDLKPGHIMTYNGRNDGSAISITFMKGQASSSTCAGRDSTMTGPQAISVYIIHVVPPIGQGAAGVQTAAATPTATPVEGTMPAGAGPTTTRSGMLPLVTIGAAAIGAVTAALRRR